MVHSLYGPSVGEPWGPVTHKKVCTSKELTAAPYVRQDVPTHTIPRRQHNALLRHAPRLLQTFLVIRKYASYRAQPD